MSNTAEQLELDAPEARASAPAHLYPHEDGRPSLDDIRPLQNQFVIDRKTIRVLARAIDIAGLSLLALFSVSGLGIPVADLPLGVALPYMALPVLTVWALKSAGAYRFPFTEKILDHMAKVGLGSSFALAGLLSFSWLTGLGGSFLYLSGTAMIGGIFLMSAHAHHVSWTKHLIRKGRLSENVVIVGATDTASQLIERNSKEIVAAAGPGGFRCSNSGAPRTNVRTSSTCTPFALLLWYIYEWPHQICVATVVGRRLQSWEINENLWANRPVINPL